ncbi:flagellar biosynthesis/type III secretory pathway chaperone [Desulfohalotomaculum tongense]|uniref:flagellar protein FlgN n=1 Tax=Desulforadius tongensis TaxID=1216062 RepID=UPI00195A2A8B|nr:flagellar protein FlgN [Desulforadius tongensis]MBM7856056.1 flagellar biosynthesis/type III secretory pathway chaperone [Desulforadius tongensis]
MEPLFFKLIEVLKEQRKAVAEMIKASEAQNQALRQADIDGLNDAVKRLTLLARQMAGLDSQREEIQLRLEKDLRLKQGAAISDLLDKAPVEMKIELKQIQLELKKGFQQLQEINALNDVLTKRALQVNSAMLKIFNPRSGQTYQNSGTIKNEGRPQAVLNKTV